MNLVKDREVTIKGLGVGGFEPRPHMPNKMLAHQEDMTFYNTHG
jgi:hypothetical protein